MNVSKVILLTMTRNRKTYIHRIKKSKENLKGKLTPKIVKHIKLHKTNP